MNNDTRKRRFGVSIPTDIADKLDELSNKLNIDRSSIIVDALKEYIHDHLHYLVPHRCTGLMILVGGNHIDIANTLEEYRDVVSMYNHMHVHGKCIETLIVSGSSNRIADLHKRLCSIGCRVRYIPVSYEITG